MTLAVAELCGAALDRNEPGARLGRPSEAGADAEAMAERRTDPGARLGRSRTSAVASGGIALVAENVVDAEDALTFACGTSDFDGLGLSVLEAVSTDVPLLIDAAGLEALTSGRDRCELGTLARTLEGAAVLGRTDAL